MLLPILAFLFASLLVAGAAMAFSANGTSAIERRLGEIAIGGGNGEAKTEPAEYRRAIIDALKRVGAAAPKSASATSRCCSLPISDADFGAAAPTRFSA